MDLPESGVCKFIHGSTSSGGGGNQHSHHLHDHLHGHSHSHEVLAGPGEFEARNRPLYQLSGKSRDFQSRALTVGITGVVGCGKSTLMLQLCRLFTSQGKNIAAITNDIFTKEDGEFLVRNNALPSERIVAIETGSCPHAAIREDISANLRACEDLTRKFNPDFILLESGGDNLSANFSRELADYIIYVIDVSGGDKIPRKGGPGVTQSDLLVINKTDLAGLVGADLEIMARDAKNMRKEGPVIFSQVKHGLGVEAIAKHILEAVKDARKVSSNKN